MPTSIQPTVHGGNHGYPVADVRTDAGELVVQVDATQADELEFRGLIERRQHGHHYRALDVGAIRLWARTRTGGSHTTLGADDRTWHRALRSIR